jgi:cell wall-associated NlpC family hydrolase
MSALEPGDLLFYGSPIHHVGIYVGGGTMVEAPHEGVPVRYASIYRSDLVGVGRPG